MLSQYDEYFIEAVSNASMDIFPENNLSKFTNRLQQTLHLDGDWVVGVNEIFYPVEIISTNNLFTGQVTSDFTNDDFSIKIDENDDVQKFVNKFNEEMQKIFKEKSTQQPRKKRSNKLTYYTELDDEGFFSMDPKLIESDLTGIMDKKTSDNRIMEQFDTIQIRLKTSKILREIDERIDKLGSGIGKDHEEIKKNWKDSAMKVYKLQLAQRKYVKTIAEMKRDIETIKSNQELMTIEISSHKKKYPLLNCKKLICRKM